MYSTFIIQKKRYCLDSGLLPRTLASYIILTAIIMRNSKLHITQYNHINEKNYLIPIGQEPCNYFVILCKNVYFRAEICNFVQLQSQISQSKCKSFCDNDGGTNCPCAHSWIARHCHVFAFSPLLFKNFFSIWLTCNRTFYSFTR